MRFDLPQDNQDYYQQRAEEEIRRAQYADDPRVVAAHYQLSELYLSRLLDSSNDVDPH